MVGKILTRASRKGALFETYYTVKLSSGACFLAKARYGFRIVWRKACANSSKKMKQLYSTMKSKRDVLSALKTFLLDFIMEHNCFIFPDQLSICHLPENVLKQRDQVCKEPWALMY